jgi:hypothetical protein
MVLIIFIIFLSVIYYRLVQSKYNHRKLSIGICIILSIYILCILIAKIVTQTIHITVPALKRDFKLIKEYNETFFCRLRAYILWSLISGEYSGYSLLVFFLF